MPDLKPRDSDIETTMQGVFEVIRRMHKEKQYSLVLKADWHATPLGPVLLAGGDNQLHLVGFLEQSSLVRKVALVQKNLGARLEPGESGSIVAAKRELDEYFAGARRAFETPMALAGTAFQNRVWEELMRRPFGETTSYTELAASIGRPAAFRAVAQASAQNLLALIIPCHRVINANGDLGGYGGGIERKRWLLDFEKGMLERTGKNAS